MKFIVADFETFFSDEYTLSKQTIEAYCRDPRFEAHGCALKLPPAPAVWIPGPDLPKVFSSLDWSDAFLICHHAQFDGLILSHHYGVRPKQWGCTLSMARVLLGNHLSVSLDSVRSHFGLPSKTTPYALFRGKRWHELSPQVQALVGRGACDEVESIWTIFLKLAENFPPEEFEVIDETIRMFTEPVLRADIPLLATLWETEENRRNVAQATLGVTGQQLRSNDAFASLLLAEGVEPEYKEGKNGPIPAFARTDEFMRGLLEDEDPRVRGLAEARLGAKSSILQTRAQTLAEMEKRGPLCVYLKYVGAATLRFAGGERTNFQNFKRQDKDNPRDPSPLRRAIKAPEGYLLAPIDLSQIEYRVCCYLAEQWDALEELRRGDDPYIGLASLIYGRAITKEMKLERGSGKVLKLSAQYMSGAATIQRTARLGTYGPPVVIDLEEAERWKKIYRDAHSAVVQYWRTANRMLSRLAGGTPVGWGPLEVRDKRIFLPNGLAMIYDTLEYHRPTEEEREKLNPINHAGYWRVLRRDGWKILHGGIITQNICEAVSRVIVTQAMVRLKRRGYRTLNVPHDELLLLIPRDGHEEKHLEVGLEEMRKEPSWLPGIPLDCEGSLSERYEK